MLLRIFTPLCWLTIALLLCGQVCKLRVWSDDGCELFEQLKLIALRMMADIAALCDERYQALCLEPGGPALLAFGVGLDEDWQGLQSCVRRQDHPEVLVMGCTSC